MESNRIDLGFLHVLLLILTPYPRDGLLYVRVLQQVMVLV
jgi:hypothetical protein